jgi:Uma2 family endonuclease
MTAALIPKLVTISPTFPGLTLTAEQILNAGQ